MISLISKIHFKKSYFANIIIMAIILSCRPGIKFEDSQSQTFIKYFGGGIEQHGKDLIETDDNGLLEGLVMMKPIA